MEDQENVVESIVEEVQEQEPKAQTINTDAIGEAMAAAGRR